jgi:hypothetical protein
MKRRPKLHLVGQEPADIFQDLDQLRAGLATPAQRRKLLVETFARIPHNKALALKISGHAWLVLIELDRIILKSRGRNPVRFWSPRLRGAELHPQARACALRQLERAGIIMIKWRGLGRSPWVFHTWYPKHP